MSKNNKNSNVKVTTNNYDVELKINNSTHKFNVKHKMDKKDKLLVTIKQQDKTYVLKLKESKNKIKVKGIQISVETKDNTLTDNLPLDNIDFIDDFEIKVANFYVPITILINPVLELYYDAKKIKTEMKANKTKVKMKKNKYTIDCTVRKEDYVVDTNALTVEELRELFDEDENNKLGVYLEFLKRHHEQEEEEEKEVLDDVKDIIEEGQEEIDKLNEKHKKEKEELHDKINKKINDKKEKMKNRKEEKVPLVDLICSVFEDCGKKEIFMKAYDKGKDEMVKVIKDLVKDKPEIEHVIIKMLDIKIEQNDEVELAKFFKDEIQNKEKDKKKNRFRDKFNHKKEIELDVKDLPKYFKEMMDTILIN